MNVGGSVNGLPIPGIFEFTLYYNKGVAFGMLQGAGVLLTPIAFGIAAYAAYHSWKHPEDSTYSHITLSLLAAGAIGNLYDRVFHGQVTDMFSFKLINFPVFNVADACISVAAGLLILKWIREPKDKETAPESVLEPSSPE